MLPIPLANANNANTIDGRLGSSFEIIAIDLVHSALKLSPRAPKAMTNKTSIWMLVANPHRNRHASAEPRQDRVITTRIGQRSESQPRRRRPGTDEAFMTATKIVPSFPDKFRSAAKATQVISDTEHM